MPNSLNKNILVTIIYYDGLDYPLTAFEVWKYLIRSDYYNQNNDSMNFNLHEVAKALKDNSISQYIENYNGFYFLKGRKELVEKRIAGGKISIEKLRKIHLIVGFLRFVPFVRMIAITGAIAMKNAKTSSDLDLLIVLKSNRIWIGRTLVTIFLQMMGKRRHGRKVSNRACLNYFVTDSSLEVITKDLFSANEYMFILPIFGWDMFEKFQLRNRWISQMKPSYGICEIAPLKMISDSAFSKAARTVGEFLLSSDWLEGKLRILEKKRIMKNPKTHQEGSLIYANDDALIFLPAPHGPMVFERFKERVENLV